MCNVLNSYGLRFFDVLKFLILLVLYLYPDYLMAGTEIEANHQGYVDSVVCANCHQEQYDGFQHVGMSQSFTAATPTWLDKVKQQTLPFYHTASQRYYNLITKGDTLLFQRYQLDEQKQKINEISVQVDYLLGSGNKATSLLFRNANNELYLLPINWYAEGEFWEMAPGYESKNHYGLSRQIKRECMFCHNAFPAEEMEIDKYWQRDIFPDKLKNGIDCQRCHGPAKAHLDQVYSNDTSIEAIRSSIVNPAKLPPGKRDSVCFQCHMLPAVTMLGMRNFTRTDYSFRPGEELTDYLLHVDLVDENVTPEQRFEINHHGYRLTQSQCFTQSNSALSCINCHNPHKKPPEEQFIKRVDSQCVSCHQGAIDKAHNKIGETCVSCHMPQRRTQDVVNVVMTDHKIGVFKDRQKLLEPLIKQEPILIDMSLWDKNIDMGGMEKDIYKLTSILQSIPSAKYAEFLKSRLQTTNYPHERPYIILAETQLKLQNYQESLALLKYIKEKFGSNLRIEELISLSLLGLNQDTEAAEKIQWLLKLDPDNADLNFNYGLLKYQQGDYSGAFELFEKAHELKQNFANTVLYKGLSKLKLGQLEMAISLFRLSLQIEPALDRSYIQLIDLYHNMHNAKDARRFFKLGLKNAILPEDIALMAQQEGKSYLIDSDLDE